MKKLPAMLKIILFLSILYVCIISASAQNIVSFDNQSGEPALVKLIGSNASEIEVPDGTRQSLHASAGKYFIKVRYGVQGKYHYTEGQEFTVDESATMASATTITLHRMVNGNYGSSPITEQEFGAGNPTNMTTNGDVTTASMPSSATSVKQRTFFPIQIVVGDIAILDNKAFACMQVQVKGEPFVGMASDDQIWSVKKLPNGYPIWASLKCSDGNFRSVFPVVLKAKVDIKTGEVIHSDGYEIEVKRAVKAGDSIPAIRVGPTSVLSAETVQGDEKTPWFTAFKEDTNANDRSIAIKAWRVEKDYVDQ